VSNEYEISTAFLTYIQGRTLVQLCTAYSITELDRQIDGDQHFICPIIRYVNVVWPLDANQRQWSIAAGASRCVRRRRRAMYAILAIFER